MKYHEFCKIDNCNICMEKNKEQILLSCYCHYICKYCYYELYNEPCTYYQI